MKKCKWTGDMSDEYCKSCNGITMEVDGNSISCEKCAGYEESDEDVVTEDVDMTPTDADKQVVEDAAKKLNKDSESDTSTNNKEKSAEKTSKTEKSNNSTANNKNVKSAPKNKETINKKEDKAVKVKEEKKAVETTNDIKVVSMRYTSGATVKKGDNYFKFVAEEEWDVSQAKQNIDDVREQLWAKLNCEVDKQIEELNSIN